VRVKGGDEGFRVRVSSVKGIGYRVKGLGYRV
jgi:hypothetical protein